MQQRIHELISASLVAKGPYFAKNEGSRTAAFGRSNHAIDSALELDLCLLFWR